MRKFESVLGALGRAVGACALLLQTVSAYALATGETSGVVNEGAPTVTFTGTFPAGTNVGSLVGEADFCVTGTVECDIYDLTVNPGAAWLSAHAQARLRITVTLDVDGDCIEAYLYNRDSSSVQAQANETCANPQVIDIAAANAVHAYYLDIVPVLTAANGYTAKVELVAGTATDPNDPDGDGVLGAADLCPLVPGPAGNDGCPVQEPGDTTFGGADPAYAGVPRYQVWAAPAGSNAEGTGGEYNIGFNPATGNIMTMSLGFGDEGPIGISSGPIFRVTPPERLSALLPESCDAEWVEKSTVFAQLPQAVADPILWTDQDTGRTFVTDLTVGANPTSQYAFSDDDGETWIPVGAGFTGADHQTIVTGPYPDGSPFEVIARTAGYGVSDDEGTVVKGKAVYFCSQDAIPGTCSRSDDGGITWSGPYVAYDGSGCNNLHGHLKVAPDGSTYLPVGHCADGLAGDATGGEQGGAYSTDAGVTWSEFRVPGSMSQAHGSDPSIAIDDAGTLYYCYVNGDGRIHAVVGTKGGDGTLSWGKDTDIGAAHGITNATFAEAVGGDAGRAACGFVGTNEEGTNYESLDFPGVWYLFIATTYDGGQTWTTVNATPSDPVQGVGGIWQQGGSATNRNLLDFNEVTIDDKGRVLFGYNDGCVGGCNADPTGSPTYVAHMRVARQTGGKTLRAAYDGQTDVGVPARAPKASCLSATRDTGGSTLAWKAPDHGGADISLYKVYSVASDGSLIHLADAPANRRQYSDTRPTAAQAKYIVKAVNSAGVGVASNAVLGPGEPPQGGGGGGAGGALAVTLGATYSEPPNGDGTYPTPVTVTFTATGSGGPDSNYRYTFNFGDGTYTGPTANRTVTHEYKYANQDGYHTKVVVTDADATQSAMSNEILIKTKSTVIVNGGTVIDLILDRYSGTAPVTVTANANGANARHNVGTASTDYTFDFGDGSAVIRNTSGTATHVYTKPEAATYTVTVTMTDKDATGGVLGTSSGSASVAVNSGNQLTALLSVNPTMVNIGDTVTFDGCHSFAADGRSITKFVLDPDGAGSIPAQDGGTTCTFQHAYTAAGSYTPTLTVYDNTGATAKVSVESVMVQMPQSPGTGGGTNVGGATGRSGGGAFGWLTLLPLGLAAARRRRAALH